ncbi:MAG: DM13 domain-containing protein [Acidobacteria bacterium]|nr:DM13 domain-containing protein [Acidobacteriota bacterium]
MNRVKEFVERRPLVSAIAAAIVLGVGAWLVFGFFGLQTLFIDEEVAEANPFVAGPGASGLAADETTEEMADAMNRAMDVAGKSGDDPVDEPMAEGVTTLAEGSFIGRAHPTTGLAKVITDGNQRFLRFEGFETDNGPDLNVYLATGSPDGSPEDFIDLGDLKGNIGDQNYELPDDVDLDRYTTVFIWCVRFSVAFGTAPLA